MDKILKLIKSPNKDDLEIGIRLLLSLPFDDTWAFFNKEAIHRDDATVLNFMVADNCSKNRDWFYVDLNDEYYFLHYYRWIRLRNKESSINENFPIISLKEYLYGEDT